MRTPDQALAALLHAFPDLEASELDAEDMTDPYLVFGDLGLEGWVETLLRDFAQENTLKRLFAFLEDLVNEGGRDVRSLVAVAFLEALAKPTGEGDSAIVTRAAHYMGPSMAYLLGMVQAFWTGTLDAFHDTVENPWADDDLLPML
jgi:hypothetical protein